MAGKLVLDIIRVCESERSKMQWPANEKKGGAGVLAGGEKKKTTFTQCLAAGNIRRKLIVLHW